MTIEELISEHKKGKYAFSVNYTHSINNHTVFHTEVDFLIGHLYEYYGGKKFNDIITDLETPPIDYATYTLEDFSKMYIQNSKKFANLYKTSKNGKTPLKQKFHKIVDSHIGELYGMYGGNVFSHIFYDLIHSGEHDKKCKMCDAKVMFLRFAQGYSIYCSARCSRLDSSKTSYDMRCFGAQKRAQTMKINLQDDIWRKEYSRKISESGKKFRETEKGKANLAQHSLHMKSLISDGLFTPCITNSWNKWSASVDGKKFRSRFEAIFYAYCLEMHIPIEFETLRIPYIHPLENIEKNYIVDFIDRENKKLYEIKPKSLKSDKIVIAKELAANKWCSDNGYTYEFVTEIDLMEFSKKLVKYKQHVLSYLEAYKWN